MTYIGRAITGYFGNPCITPQWRLPIFALGILELAMWMVSRAAVELLKKLHLLTSSRHSGKSSAPQKFVSRRIQEEESMLKREMGKEYVEYMRDVPARLIPGLL